MHPIFWKGCSTNFALTAFSEVGFEVRLVVSMLVVEGDIPLSL
jgi:hypothetical protein